MVPGGCFYNAGVLFEGVLRVRALLFGVCIRAPDFLEPPMLLRGVGAKGAGTGEP